MNDVIELCKRRGFIFHSSEIYGGLQGVYDYGPLGVELKNNLKNAWWRDMVHKRGDIEGLDSSILTHRLTLKNSQHEETFYDEMVDCKICNARLRLDELIDNACSKCGFNDLTEPRPFNLMFKCKFGPIEGNGDYVYLRPETAQGIFINLKNVLNSTQRKLPFGIAQIGKAFRNEIQTKNFTFRTREFEQMEIEFFVEKGEDEEWHKRWVEERVQWWIEQGLGRDNILQVWQSKGELSHYAKATVDIMYRFPHGFGEIEGISNRSDFDLGSHSKNNSSLNISSSVKVNDDSNAKLTIKDEIGDDIVPYVIEPSAGVDRGILAILTEAYTKEKLDNGSERIVLKLKHHLAPYKVAVIPLARNNDKIVAKAKQILKVIQGLGIGRIKYEDSGNIGKSYRRQDEIGTPTCVTIDFETIENEPETVTIRDRDSMEQRRVSIPELLRNLKHFYYCDII